MEHSGDARRSSGLAIGRGKHTQKEDSFKSSVPERCISVSHWRSFVGQMSCMERLQSRGKHIVGHVIPDYHMT
jgi:hypothetical protein